MPCPASFPTSRNRCSDKCIKARFMNSSNVPVSSATGSLPIARFCSMVTLPPPSAVVCLVVRTPKHSALGRVFQSQTRGDGQYKVLHRRNTRLQRSVPGVGFLFGATTSVSRELSCAITSCGSTRGLYFRQPINPERTDPQGVREPRPDPHALTMVRRVARSLRATFCVTTAYRVRREKREWKKRAS